MQESADISCLETFALELTSVCNLTCRMCSLWMKGQAGLPAWKERSLLREARHLGAKSFSASGAEIFLREDAADMLAYAEELGFEEVTVVSNGTLLGSARLLDRLENLRALHIAVSIDGPREIHDRLRGRGVYEKAVASIREMRRRGISCGITSILMRQTLEGLPSMIDLCADLGVGSFAVQPYVRDLRSEAEDHSAFEFHKEDEGLLTEAMKRLGRYAQRRRIFFYTESLTKHMPAYLTRGVRPIPSQGCSIPSRTLIVEGNGTCYSCFTIRQNVGSVHESSLEKIWHDSQRLEIARRARKGKCPGCLAACSDIQAHNADSKARGPWGRIRRYLEKAYRRG